MDYEEFKNQFDDISLSRETGLIIAERLYEQNKILAKISDRLDLMSKYMLTNLDVKAEIKSKLKDIDSDLEQMVYGLDAKE